MEQAAIIDVFIIDEIIDDRFFHIFYSVVFSYSVDRKDESF